MTARAGMLFLKPHEPAIGYRQCPGRDDWIHLRLSSAFQTRCHKISSRLIASTSFFSRVSRGILYTWAFVRTAFVAHSRGCLLGRTLNFGLDRKSRDLAQDKSGPWRR